MNGNVSTALHVLAMSEHGVQCATNASPGDPFWLPRRYVAWVRPPEPGAFVTAIIPEWLAQKHKQLSAVASEFQNADTQTRNSQMANMKDNSGALFRVPDEDKKTEKWPDMKGDVLIDGVKWWISGWTRTSEKTGKKYLSLALRKADEKPAEANPKLSKAPAMNDDSIPF